MWLLVKTHQTPSEPQIAGTFTFIPQIWYNWFWSIYIPTGFSLKKIWQEGIIITFGLVCKYGTPTFDGSSSFSSWKYTFIWSEMARFQTLRLLNHIVGCISTSIPPLYPHCGWYSNRKKHEGPSAWELKLALKNWMPDAESELHAIRTYRICGFSTAFLMVLSSKFDPFHPFLDPFHPFP